MTPQLQLPARSPAASFGGIAPSGDGTTGRGAFPSVPGQGFIPKGLCRCGCGERTPIATRTRRYLGTVEGQPVAFAPGHGSALNRSDGYEIRDFGYDTPCWVWTGALRRGYGQASRQGRHIPAHRLFYELRHGSLPSEMEVHHRCENKRCVNPDHLQALTPGAHMDAHGARKLCAEHVSEARRLYAARQCTQQELADRFGVTRGTMWAALRRRTWKEIA